jgi:Na+/H+ antiporter NhaD/arsenite permease-like protein
VICKTQLITSLLSQNLTTCFGPPTGHLQVIFLKILTLQQYIHHLYKCEAIYCFLICMYTMLREFKLHNFFIGLHKMHIKFIYASYVILWKIKIHICILCNPMKNKIHICILCNPMITINFTLQDEPRTSKSAKKVNSDMWPVCMFVQTSCFNRFSFFIIDMRPPNMKSSTLKLTENYSYQTGQ